MQKEINEYFNKLCTDKFFKNDDETIIGKAKDVIQNLKQQCKNVKNPANNVDKEDIKFITSESKSLIKKIKDTYSNEDDIVGLYIHPMAGFYVLMNRESLLEELKEYYDEMED